MGSSLHSQAQIYNKIYKTMLSCSSQRSLSEKRQCLPFM
uniref:Uncharacterized protein n=1 Tax=Arundo donax TaxID=35708 RepID=A0A0A8YPL5_ARUDO